ncbi:hypothetical protein ABQJ54_11405 [Rhodanobacter sp. Si-c]|uniref:Uncharacterized protein n=1 Tax=Rhodanobacter lycopersici TaxID=3162487 RepID=A0ABV3QGE8_9GAMM
MKKAQIFYVILLIVALSGAAFFAGLHWKEHEVKVQPTSALGAQLACEASSLENNIAVASLLDKNNSDDAKDVLMIGIKSSVTKLKAFEPYSGKGDRAMVTDALQDGETYLSTKRSP